MAPSRRGRTLAVAGSSSHGPAVLPLYQPLSNPLNQEAQHELRNLHKTHRLDGLKSHLSKANERIIQAAGDVSVCYLTNSITYEKRKARRLENKENDEDNAQDANEDTRMITKMKSNTESMLKSLEEGVRKTIDAKASVEAIEAALKGLDALAPNSQGANAPTQSTLGVSQPRDKRRQRGSDSSGSESDHEHDPSQIQPPLNVLKRKINQFHSEYDNLSMRDRYASHNDYIGFKKTVHESSYPPNDEPPMPHASTWFADSASHSGAKGRDASNDQAGAEDTDNDIEVASERISIKCPLTLLDMRDPVSSKKCPHSFERQAILEMISVSQMRIKSSNGKLEQHIKCPVCEVLLSASDLHRDPILLRKINRIHAAQAAPESDSDSAPTGTHPRGTQLRAEEIDSDHDDDDDGDNRVARSRRGESAAAARAKLIKREGTVPKREVSMVPATQLDGQDGSENQPPGTQIVDLEDEEGEETEDDGDEEEEEEEEEGEGEGEEDDDNDDDDDEEEEEDEEEGYEHEE